MDKINTIYFTVVVWTILYNVFLSNLHGALVQFPIDTTAKAGSDVRLNCSTDNKRSVMWQHGKQPHQMVDVYIGGAGGGGLEKPYSKTNRHSVIEDLIDGIYDLIIKNVSKDDEGIYTCSERGSRDDPRRAKLTVEGPENDKKCNLEDVITAEGDFAKLTFSSCKVRPYYIDHLPVGKSHADDVYNLEKLVNDYAKCGRFRVEDRGDNCALIITEVQSSEAGTYNCRENSGHGHRHEKNLVVCVPQKCSKSEEVTSNIGVSNQVLAYCAANIIGHREPLIRWIENNCNGSLCHVQNLTFDINGTVQECEIIYPTLDTTLSLRCLIKIETRQIDSTGTDGHSSALWVFVVPLLTCLLVVIIVIATIVIAKKKCRKSKHLHKNGSEDKGETEKLKQ